MAMPEYGAAGLNSHFTHFLGQTVTVCVEGAGCAGRCFSGLLAGVCSDHIRLLHFMEPSLVRRRFRTVLSYRRASGCRPFRPGFEGFGVVTCIPVKKIVAFSHSTLPFLAPELNMEKDRPQRVSSFVPLPAFVLLVIFILKFISRANAQAGFESSPLSFLYFSVGQAMDAKKGGMQTMPPYPCLLDYLTMTVSVFGVAANALYAALSRTV